MVLISRQINKSEIEAAVGWRKRKLSSVEACASQCIVYYPA